MRNHLTFLASVLFMSCLMAATPPGKHVKRLPRLTAARPDPKPAAPKTPPMPLAIFETKMDSWIKSQQAIAGKN